MADNVDRKRRLLLGAALSGVATRAFAQGKRTPSLPRMEPLKRVDAGVLNIAYYETGPAAGPPGPPKKWANIISGGHGNFL